MKLKETDEVSHLWGGPQKVEGRHTKKDGRRGSLITRTRKQMAPPTSRSPKKPMTVSGNFCWWCNSEKKKEYQTILKPFQTLPCCSKIVQKARSSAEFHERIRPGCNSLFTFRCVWPQGCSSPIVVKFADTQKDKEQRRLQQQLAQQMQQLNTATWGNLTGLGGLTPQYLAVSAAGWSVCGPQERGEQTHCNSYNLLVP